MLKTLVIAKTAKAVVREVKKYNLSATLDRNTSKFVITIQKKAK